MRNLLLIAAVALSGCVPSEPPLRVTQQAVGEPVDGFPSYEERVAWVWANRARQDPAAELADCDQCADKACYTPNPPLTWSHELGRAARFHSDSLVNNGLGIQHDSPCDVVADISQKYKPGTCNGEASCACEGGTLGCAGQCPRFDARLRLFGAFAAAENVHSTGNPQSAIFGFTHEPYDVSTCGYGYDSMNRPNGHRFNVINSGGSVGIGIGENGRILTMDFGGPGEPPSKLVSGVHTPKEGPQLEFHANWYDDAGPTTALVNVEGECTAMTLDRGTPENGAFLATASVPSGCARYRFEFTDASGATVYFPSSGSFGIACAGQDSLPDPPPQCGCVPDCAGKVCGDDGCGSSCGSCDAPDECDPMGQCVCPPSACPADVGGADAGSANNGVLPDPGNNGTTTEPAPTGVGPGTDPEVVIPDDDGGVHAEGKACSHATGRARSWWWLPLLVLLARRF